MATVETVSCMFINGASVDSAQVYAGFREGSTASVNVIGADSLWTSRSGIHIGRNGDASLTLADGGQVTAGTYFAVGGKWSLAQGTVTIYGPSSALNVMGYLDINIGEMTATNGAQVVSGNTTSVGASAAVTMLGPGSQLTSNANLDISGTLSLFDEATVTVARDSIVNSAGEIHLDHSTLTTGSLLTGTAGLTGIGTVETHGLVSDVDLVFNSPDSLEKTILFDQLPEQDISIHLTQTESGCLGAGFSGNATLYVANGMDVECRAGYLGYELGSQGDARITGAGSEWACGALTVGRAGNGSVLVESGGSIDVEYAIGIGASPASKGEIHVQGSDSTLASTLLDVGSGGEGIVHVQDGALVRTSSTSVGAYRAYLDDQIVRSNGTVVVEGRGSCWTASGGMTIGSFGNGEFSVRNGAVVTCGVAGVGGSGSASPNYYPELWGDGNLLVDGPGSTFSAAVHLAVGVPGEGTVRVTNSGTLNTTRAFLGSKADYAEGTAIVDGAGSIWTNKEELHIGAEGSGILNITNGGLVSTVSASVADSSTNSQGTVTVDGSGSIWTIGRDLVVGKAGSGTMTVMNRGLVTNRHGCIGELPGSTGKVAVGNASGSRMTSLWLNRFNLTIGEAGRGILQIDSCGKVQCASAVIGERYGSHGIVEVTGRSAELVVNNGTLQVGGGGNAVMRISGGGVVSSRSAIVLSEGGLSRQATVIVEGVDSTWINEWSLHIQSYAAADGGVPNGIVIRDGGTVSGGGLFLNAYGVVSLGVDNGSQLIAEHLINVGRIHVSADTRTSRGDFTPVSVDVWEGPIFVPLGGTWDNTSRVFTVHDAPVRRQRRKRGD